MKDQPVYYFWVHTEQPNEGIEPGYRKGVVAKSIGEAELKIEGYIKEHQYVGATFKGVEWAVA